MQKLVLVLVLVASHGFHRFRPLQSARHTTVATPTAPVHMRAAAETGRVRSFSPGRLTTNVARNSTEALFVVDARLR